jgi:hypothetical protein
MLIGMRRDANKIRFLVHIEIQMNWYGYMCEILRERDDTYYFF